MIEFDVDMQLVADEMDLVVLHDECGEMEPVEYVPRSEVEKLRKLVHTIWLAGDFRAFLGVGELEVRMRELGIEVNA